MRIAEIVARINETLTLKDELAEELFKINIDIAVAKAEMKPKYAKALVHFKDSRLPMQMAEGALAKTLGDIEVMEAKKMYVFNKLENARTDAMILSSLLKVEQELLS